MSENWTEAASVKDVDDEGGVLSVVLEGRRIALYDVEGEFFATDDLCTHGAARLSDGYLDGIMIECPLHQGTFDVRTGQPTSAPCVLAVATHPVKREGDMLYVNVQEAQ